MRLHRLHLRTWLVPLGVALGLTSCGDPVGVGSFTVTYRANTVGVATIDSILYDNGTGGCATSCNADSTMVKVVSPSTTYRNSIVMPAGSTVQVHLYGSGTAAGTAQLTMLWMTPTGGITGDSATATTAAAAKFTIDLSKRAI
jgi:hypothetical protein